MSEPPPALAPLEQACGAAGAEWAGALPRQSTEVEADARAMSDAGLVRVTESLAVLARRVEMLQARCAAELAARSRGGEGADLARAQGFASPERLIAQATGRRYSEAAKLVAVGEATAQRASFTGESLPPRHPHVAAALEAGTLCVDAAETIRRFLDAVAARADPSESSSAEALLVERAPQVGVDGLVRLIKYLEARLDPDGVKPREDELRSRRGLKIWEDASGMINLRGAFDPATGAPIKLAVEALVGAELHTARDARRTFGEAGPKAGAAGAERSAASDANAPAASLFAEDRTIAQLNADALADIARHSLGAKHVAPALRAATVVVRVDADAIVSGHGHATIDGIEQPVSVATARELAMSAGISPLLLDRRSERLDLGRATRLFTPAQKIVLVDRDGGCAWPGCRRPPSHSQAHHIAWWERDDGETNHDNGIMLCSHHHHRVHDDGWRIFIRDRCSWFVSATRTSTPSNALDRATSPQNDSRTSPSPSPTQPEPGRLLPGSRRGSRRSGRFGVKRTRRSRSAAPLRSLRPARRSRVGNASRRSRSGLANSLFVRFTNKRERNGCAARPDHLGVDAPHSDGCLRPAHGAVRRRPDLHPLARPAADDKVLPEHARGHNRALVLQTLYRRGAEPGRSRPRDRAHPGHHLRPRRRAHRRRPRHRDRPARGRPPRQARHARRHRPRRRIQIIGIDLSEHDGLPRRGARPRRQHPRPRRGRTLDGATGEAVVSRSSTRSSRSRRPLATLPMLGIGVGSPGVVDLARRRAHGAQPRLERRASAGARSPPRPAARCSSPTTPTPRCSPSTASAARSDDMMLIKVGHGVGAGLLLGGSPMFGSRFAAGEIGHVVVGTDGGAALRVRQARMPRGLARRPAAHRAARSSTADAQDRATRSCVDAGERLGIALAPVVGALDLSRSCSAAPPNCSTALSQEAAVETLRKRTMAEFHGDLTRADDRARPGHRPARRGRHGPVRTTRGLLADPHHPGTSGRPNRSRHHRTHTQEEGKHHEEEVGAVAASRLPHCSRVSPAASAIGDARRRRVRRRPGHHVLGHGRRHPRRAARLPEDRVQRGHRRHPHHRGAGLGRRRSPS